MKISKLCLLLCALLTAFPTLSGAEKVIRLTSGEWSPYTSPEMDGYGVLSRIVTEAFSLEGVTAEYGFFPWKRSLEYAKSGEWDGSIGWSPQKDREAFFYYSEPVIESKDVFFHLKERPIQWTELSDLSRVKIGGGLGYYYGEAFKKAEEDGVIIVHRSTDDVLSLKKLLGGRIDTTVINLHVGYFLLNKNFESGDIARVTHHPKLLNSTTIHILLSKNVAGNAVMLEKFNRGLKKLKESGGYDEIMKDIEPGNS